MPSVTGTVLLVQESRFRLLTDDGRGLTFLLAYDASMEPQDLPPLTDRRVRVDYSDPEKPTVSLNPLVEASRSTSALTATIGGSASKAAGGG